MTQNRTPNWHPIEQISTIAYLIDGLLESTEEQHVSLLEARAKPHVLDDSIVERAEKLYTSQTEDFWFFTEQLSRWRKLSLTSEQEKEVTRLEHQDEEVAIAMLTSQLKPPF